jgi:hypothetical protein
MLLTMTMLVVVDKPSLRHVLAVCDDWVARQYMDALIRGTFTVSRGTGQTINGPI